MGIDAATEKAELPPHHKPDGTADMAAVWDGLKKIKGMSPSADQAAVLNHLQGHVDDESAAEEAGETSDQEAAEEASKSQGGKHTMTQTATPEAEATAKAEAERTAVVAKAEAERAEAVAKAADLQTRLEKQEKDLAAMIEKGERAEMVIKAEQIAKHVLGDKADLANMLYAISKKAPEIAEQFDALLKSADEVARTSNLFKEVGRSGSNGTGVDAMAEIQKQAEEIRKADPKLTQEQSVARVIRNNPALYSKYREERDN